MNRTVIVNTGLCNLHSIARALEECGGNPVVTDDPQDLERAARIVLPGVGSFPAAMSRLHERGLVDALHDQVVGNEIPFLGICLGMQLLATVGQEVESTPGLGWLEGEVLEMRPSAGERIPHVGWNSIELAQTSPLFAHVDTSSDFYFVHSYALAPKSESVVLARTDHAGGFVSAVQMGHIFGVQFHPEKSQRVGFEVLRNFLSV